MLRYDLGPYIYKPQPERPSPPNKPLTEADLTGFEPAGTTSVPSFRDRALRAPPVAHAASTTHDPSYGASTKLISTRVIAGNLVRHKATGKVYEIVFGSKWAGIRRYNHDGPIMDAQYVIEKDGTVLIPPDWEVVNPIPEGFVRVGQRYRHSENGREYELRRGFCGIYGTRLSNDYVILTRISDPGYYIGTKGVNIGLEIDIVRESLLMNRTTTNLERIP